MSDAIDNAPPVWRPHRRPSGRVEINVNYYDLDLSRETFGSLTPEQYIAAWKDRRLDFQRDQQPKPDHLPTLEQVAAFLGRTDIDEYVPAPSTYEAVEADDVDEAEAEGEACVESVPEDQPLLLVLVPGMRKSAATKLAVMRAVAAQLRSEKQAQHQIASGEVLVAAEIQLAAHELVARTAQELSMSRSGVRTYLYRYVTDEVRGQLLAGTCEHVLTHAEKKFEILMQVREQLRKKGGPKPRKKELAEAAATPLGMQLASTRTYVYDKLTAQQVVQLDLRKRPLSHAEAFEVLVKVRTWMKTQKQPAPRITDLVSIAAPYVVQKPASLRVLIGRLSAAQLAKLELRKSWTDAFVGVEPTVIREGFLGALAVLRLRKRRPTVTNLRATLRLPLALVKAYLAETPNIAALLEKDD